MAFCDTHQTAAVDITCFFTVHCSHLEIVLVGLVYAFFDIDFPYRFFFYLVVILTKLSV